MNVDIHDAVVMIVILAIGGSLVSLLLGVRQMRKSRQVSYYRLRQQAVSHAWWTLLLAPFLAGLAYVVGAFGEPVAYRYFPPSPTPSPSPTTSLTPTISQTPTISPIPSLTDTPAESHTPTITPTPFMPEAIALTFTSLVTPNPGAVFSPLQFSRQIADFVPVDPQTVFENPVGRIFATFSYEGMIEGAQWTALWFRDGELVHHETEPWQGSTGGYGAYSLWAPPAEEWLPGTYQVIMFVGLEWKVLGEFRVSGAPPTPTFTLSPTITPTITPTLRPSATPRPSDTRWPTPQP